MKEREELEMILTLIRKYNLPLSPILEYAIKEKMEEYPERDSSNDIKESLDNYSITGNNIDLKETQNQENVSEFKSNDIHDDLIIEHVYLDTQGKVIDSSSSEDIIPEKDLINEDRKEQSWTKNEEELVILFYKQCKNLDTVAKIIGRTESSVKTRLKLLGLIDGADVQKVETPDKSEIVEKKESDNDDFSIKNNFVTCTIINKSGETVFSTEGKLIFIHKKLYLYNLDDECFTAKEMQFMNGRWRKGKMKIVAYPQSDLYKEINKFYDCYQNVIEDIFDSSIFEDCRLKINGIWYSYDGNLYTPETIINEDLDKNVENDDAFYSQFSVKIGDVLKLFPSQLIGTVTNLRLDSKGHRKIVVKADDGPIVSIYDNKYLYQKIYRKDKKQIAGRNAIVSNSEKYVKTPKRNNKAELGCWIQWKPTGDVGKVIGFRQVGSLHKIVLQLKGGSQMEVYDNPKAYEIILRA